MFRNDPAPRRRRSTSGMRGWSLTMTAAAGDDDRQSMIRKAQRMRRLSAWIQVLALAVVASSACLPGAEATPTQEACCGAMHHDCHATGLKQSCCTIETPRFAAAITGSLVSTLASMSLVAVGPVTLDPESLLQH